MKTNSMALRVTNDGNVDILTNASLCLKSESNFTPLTINQEVPSFNKYRAALFAKWLVQA